MDGDTIPCHRHGAPAVGCGVRDAFPPSAALGGRKVPGEALAAPLSHGASGVPRSPRSALHMGVSPTSQVDTVGSREWLSGTPPGCRVWPMPVGNDCRPY